MAEARGIKYQGNTGLAIAQGDALKGDVFQLPDGRAAVVPADTDSGLPFIPEVSGSREFDKSSGVTFLDGDEAWFDHSARTVTYKPANDRDFYLGTVVGDTSATAARVLVNVNNRAVYCVPHAEAAMYGAAQQAKPAKAPKPPKAPKAPKQSKAA